MLRLDPTCFVRVFLGLFFLCFMGCSEHLSKEKLAGKYVLSVSDGTDAIELKIDGTYTHSFQDKKGAQDTHTGTWQLQTLDAGLTVILDGFRPLMGEQIQGEGFYLLPIKSSFGKITLITNLDTNEGYERQR